MGGSGYGEIGDRLRIGTTEGTRGARPLESTRIWPFSFGCLSRAASFLRIASESLRRPYATVSNRLRQFEAARAEDPKLECIVKQTLTLLEKGKI